MIIIKKVLNYRKYIGIFILIELFISFILGFLNLIGISYYITKLISFILNIVLFFLLSFFKGKNTNKKGYIEGLLNGCKLIISLFIITLIFFIKSIHISTLIYYIILLSSSVIGAVLGKNIKKDNK